VALAIGAAALACDVKTDGLETANRFGSAVTPERARPPTMRFRTNDQGEAAAGGEAGGAGGGGTGAAGGGGVGGAVGGGGGEGGGTGAPGQGDAGGGYGAAGGDDGGGGGGGEAAGGGGGGEASGGGGGGDVGGDGGGSSVVGQDRPGSREMDASTTTAPSADGGADRPRPPDLPASCPRGHPDLSLCLRFENEVVDDSPVRHAVAASNVGFERGLYGQAGRFGPQGGVAVPESAALDSARVTIEAWINPRTLPLLATQMGLLDNNAQYGLFLRPGGTLVCVGRGTAAATAAARAGVWTSVACTFDQTVTIWINGIQRGQAPSLGPLEARGTTGTSVGRDNPLGGNNCVEAQAAPPPEPHRGGFEGPCQGPAYYDGLLDNVRVWRSVRTAEEICAAALDCRKP
jgi:hypothetical protein